MAVSDELTRIDGVLEGQVLKTVESMRSLVDGNAEQLRAQLLVNDRSIESYLKSFQWNSIKYRTDRPVSDIAQTVAQEVSGVDAMIRNKMAAYQQTRGSLVGVERKQQGNLSVKSLSGVVRKENFITDSEYLQTVLVAVPKSSDKYKEFLDQYETLTQFVIPRSAVKIQEDDEYGLFAVVVFQRVVDEYKNKLREGRFIPRDYVYDPVAIEAEKREAMALGASSKEQWSALMRICKSNFGEMFSGWVHLKVLRVFVESVLRYGLPVDFQAMIVQCKLKQEKKVEDLLKDHYAKLGSSIAKGNDKDEPMEDLQGLMFDKHYTPYVSFDLVWNE